MNNGILNILFQSIVRLFHIFAFNIEKHKEKYIFTFVGSFVFFLFLLYLFSFSCSVQLRAIRCSNAYKNWLYIFFYISFFLFHRFAFHFSLISLLSLYFPLVTFRHVPLRVCITVFLFLLFCFEPILFKTFSCFFRLRPYKNAYVSSESHLIAIQFNVSFSENETKRYKMKYYSILFITFCVCSFIFHFNFR